MNTLAKWSIDDYHQMVEAGILRDRKVELLQGEIVEMPPEKPIHYATANEGSHYLSRLLKGKADVRFNGPITLTDSEPEPDIAVVKIRESRYRDRHPTPEDIYWVIEVAQSSQKKDLEVKREIYAAAGIPEYWVIDLSAQQLIVFRRPEQGEYRDRQVVNQGTLTSFAFSEEPISVETLLIT